MIESWIFCEGFDDRDFLAGWLEHVHGWCDTRPRHGGQSPLLFGGESTAGLKGVFFFDHPKEERRVGIVPVGSREKVGRRLRMQIEAAEPGILRVAVIVVVADQDSASAASVVDLARNAVVTGGAPAPTGPPPWSVSGTQIEVVTMRAGEVGPSDLDPQERLERVVTAAFAQTYPKRYANLREWLQRRPDPAGNESMAAHWGAMAGWFSDSSPADYLRRAIWLDAAMRESLKNILSDTGLPEVTSRLVSS